MGARVRSIPQTKEACFAHSNVVGVGSTLESAQNNDRESSRVFQRISEVLTAPTQAWVLASSVPDPTKLNQALTQPNQARDADNDWYHVCSPTASIRLVRRREPRR